MLNKKTVCTVVLLALLSGLVVADEKPTSISDARVAIDANLGTPQGKAYDEQFGKEFLQKHVNSMRQCKRAAGKDSGKFWMLLKLDKNGNVKELLLHPETKLGICARDTLLKSRFSPPPRPAYWVGVYMKVTH